MTERPILFSAAMVRAILSGTKTQTRRVAKPRVYPSLLDGGWSDSYVFDEGNREWLMRDFPYGQPGDRLWVRETWAYGVHALSAARCEDGPFVYAADGTTQGRLCDRWRPSIHMPRSASRLTLEITGRRAERLQDISESDARAEGVVPSSIGEAARKMLRTYKGIDLPTAILQYADLWDSINGAGSWASNPWVWVIDFEVMK